MVLSSTIQQTAFSCEWMVKTYLAEGYTVMLLGTCLPSCKQQNLEWKQTESN